MRKFRWLIYILVGIVFGVIDYYVQIVLVRVENSLTYIILACGVWLIPLVPLALYEVKTSGSKLRAVFASVSVWVVAVFAYYMYILYRLMFVGQESRIEMHISNSGDPHYWGNVWSIFLGDVLYGFVEWLLVAIVGGAIIGFLVAVIYKKARAKYFKEGK